MTANRRAQVIWREQPGALTQPPLATDDRGRVNRRFCVIPEPYGVHGRFKGSILSGALCSLPGSDRRLPLWLLLGGSLPSEVGDELFNLRGVESITHGIEYLFPCHRGEIPLSSFPAIRHLEERGAP